MQKKYPFQLLPLDYPYHALEPYIDEQTMHYHHDKHLKTYVENLNRILQEYPSKQSLSLTQILENIASFPINIQTSLRNNAGGVYNHELYFKIIHPYYTSNRKKNELLQKIQETYGGVDPFIHQFQEKAKEVFGSGYTFLVCNKFQELEIVNRKNQENPLENNLKPIVLMDLWEHAYYLKYKNERNQYIENFMKLINFDVANDIYLSCLKEQ